MVYDIILSICIVFSVYSDQSQLSLVIKPLLECITSDLGEGPWHLMSVPFLSIFKGTNKYTQISYPYMDMVVFLWIPVLPLNHQCPTQHYWTCVLCLFESKIQSICTIFARRSVSICPNHIWNHFESYMSRAFRLIPPQSLRHLYEIQQYIHQLKSQAL